MRRERARRRHPRVHDPSKAGEESLTPSCSRSTTLEAFFFSVGRNKFQYSDRRRRPCLNFTEDTDNQTGLSNLHAATLLWKNTAPSRCRLMAAARAALRLRPSPLSAQSPPTYWLHDVITSQTFLQNYRFFLAIVDRHYLYNKPGYVARTRDKCGRSVKQVNSG